MSLDNPEEFAQFVALHFARQDVLDRSVSFGVPVLTVMRAAVLRVASFLYKDPACRFTQLTDATAVHRPERSEPFELIYRLTSSYLNRSVCLKLFTQADVPTPSFCPVFRNAAWYEREMREMFGLSFDGHPDLRRLLTTETLAGFPLLKTFPEKGRKRIVYRDGALISEDVRPDARPNAVAVVLNGE